MVKFSNCTSRIYVVSTARHFSCRTLGVLGIGQRENFWELFIVVGSAFKGDVTSIRWSRLLVVISTRESSSPER